MLYPSPHPENVKFSTTNFKQRSYCSCVVSQEICNCVPSKSTIISSSLHLLKCLPLSGILSRPCNNASSGPVPSHLIGKYPPHLPQNPLPQDTAQRLLFRLPETQFSGNGCDEQQKSLPSKMFNLHCGNWLGSIAHLVSGGSERV